jgi:hypothetical protein
MFHQLQTCIRTNAISLNELGRRAGVTEEQLSRFLRGDRTLTLPAAARGLYFGFELCPQKEPFPTGRKGNGHRASPSGKSRTRRNPQ